MMKLTILILFISLMEVSAATFGQVVTLKKDRISLKNAFAEIKSQTGYNLFASAKIELSTKVSANFDRQPLYQVIEKLLEGLPLEFSIEQKTIVIKQKESSFFEILKNAILAMDVVGKVVDENGKPLLGASVSVKETNYTTTTDENGNFTLKNVAPNSTIVIAYIGFERKELAAKSNMGQIKLVASTSKLDEIMVVAYGTTTKRLSTGSVSQVSAADFEKQPISNPIIGLQGRVSGAFITQSAGFAGAPVSVVIRGQNSLQAQTNNITSPLYIVDGVPFSSTPVEQSVGGFSVTNAFSPLNTLDPNQIESINVLKDADATAIYGSRGANGVVLITTKKGKAGDTQIAADLSAGFGEVTNTIKMATTEQFLAIRRQAFANDNVTPTAVNAPDLVLWSPTTYNNFPDIIMGGTQKQRRATVAISGGDHYNQFLLSGNYRHESTVMPSNTADNAFQFHTSSQHRSRNNKFGANVSVSYNIDNNAVPNYSTSVTNYGLAPNYPLYNSNGSLYFGGGNVNPLALFNSTYSVKSTNLITNGTLNYLVLPNLNLKVNAGYNYNSTFAATVVPPSAANPATNPVTSTTMSNNYINTYIVEPQANYSRAWGKSKLTVLAGATWQETKLVQPYFIVGNVNNVQLATSLSALTILSKSSNTSDYKYVSGFGRVTYEWDGKYLVSANIRRDGSSRFGSSNPYGNFGSGA